MDYLTPAARAKVDRIEAVQLDDEPSAQTRPLMTRIPSEMVPRIDAQRGDVPRERWIRRRLEELLDGLEASSADTDRTIRA